MRKEKAIRLPLGTIVLIEAPETRHLSYSEKLGRLEHATPRGGMLITPVVERFGEGITYKAIGQARWWPYSKVQPFLN